MLLPSAVPPLFIFAIEYRGKPGQVECKIRSSRDIEDIKKDLPTDKSYLVGSDAIFSHRFLEDLEKMWAMREWIPDPTKPILPNQLHD